MLLTCNSIASVFYIALLLAILPSSYAYTYSCNASAACGCSLNPASVTRIVGGELAGTSTWSWAVSISIGGVSLCGGAILSSSWIISAAHCFIKSIGSTVTIYAGSDIRFRGQSRIASRVIIHPDYLGSTQVNDIALIELSTPLTMTDTVKTICIPSVSSSSLVSGEWPAANLYVVAVGWGTLSENGSLPSSLQQVTLQTVAYDASTCRSVLYNQRYQFCAGVPGGGKDTCQGDSGGPLMMYTASQQWVLVGVTSYGVGCGRRNYAGVYTRVAAYQDWIAATTGNAYTNPILSNSSDVNTARSSATMEKASISFSMHLGFCLIFILSLTS